MLLAMSANLSMRAVAGCLGRTVLMQTSGTCCRQEKSVGAALTCAPAAGLHGRHQAGPDSRMTTHSELW